MLDVTASYGMTFDFIAFFWHFHTLLLTIHVWSVLSKFHKLCVRLVLTFWFVDKSGMTACYGRLTDLNAFFDNFQTLLDVWNVKAEV